MQRRSFLKGSLATLGAATAAGVEVRAAEAGAGEMYELKTYTLKPAMLDRLHKFLKEAYIPAIKKMGYGPVGVFAEPPEGETVRVAVLTVFPANAPIASLPAKLASDEAFKSAAADYLQARPTEPIYTRIESALLAPISGMPKLARPDAGKPRLLNLRVYESHNERAARKKIEMFNVGELEIFKRVGLTPVFFAETVVGAAMPNLTYMLVFPNEDGRKAAWNRFRDDAEWKKLRAIPEYADKEIVSKITNKILTPADYSEI